VGMSEVTDTLRELQARYGSELDEALFERLDGNADATFVGMMRYQFGYVDEWLNPVPASPGKRFRPLLCLLACDFVGGRWREALTAAAAIELVHNFSLIHDDIEDRDPARRHRPTVWKVWGEPQAINVGDAVFAEAVRSVLQAHPNSQVCLELARGFGDVVLHLTEGQYMDMSFETQSAVTPEEYMAMIERKTAQLIAFSLWAGSVIGGASDETARRLHTYGLELGKAFQIHDDIMGIWGAPEVTGKAAGKDLQNRKKTLPVLVAAYRGTVAQREELRRFFERESDDMDSVLDILTVTGALSESREQVREHLAVARGALTGARLRAGAGDELERLAAQITGQ
jgi:geranylgeranyl diphosphate synthase type I